MDQQRKSKKCWRGEESQCGRNPKTSGVAIRRTIRFFCHSCPCSLCVLCVSVIVDLLSKRSPQKTERDHREISSKVSRAGPRQPPARLILGTNSLITGDNQRERTHIAGVTSKPVNHCDGPHTVCILALESGQREFRNEGTRIGWPQRRRTYGKNEIN